MILRTAWTTDRPTKVNILTNLTLLAKVHKANWSCLRQSEFRDWDTGNRFLSQAERNAQISGVRRRFALGDTWNFKQKLT